MPNSAAASSRPALLALHGFSGGGADFLPLAQALAQEADWHLPDLPGHASSHALPCGPEAVIGFVEDHCQKLTLPRILLGYSMGARAALLHATTYPKSWQGLILISARSGIASEQARAERRKLDTERAAQILTLGVSAFLKQWQQQPLIRSQENIPTKIHADMQATRKKHTAAGLANSLQNFGQGNCPDLQPLLGRLTMPVCLISGEKDHQYHLYAEQMLGQLPNSIHRVIPDTGHMPHLENLPATTGVIHDFIKNR